MTCEKCGAEIQLSEWPWCPHGRGANVVEGDDRYIGGMTLQNLGHEPVTVYSRSELRRVMKERGVEPFVRHMPIPGSDKSPHTTRWAGMDPYTMEQARILLERVGTQKSRPKTDEERYWEACGEPPLTGGDVREIAEKIR